MTGKNFRGCRILLLSLHSMCVQLVTRNSEEIVKYRCQMLNDSATTKETLAMVCSLLIVGNITFLMALL